CGAGPPRSGTPSRRRSRARPGRCSCRPLRLPREPFVPAHAVEGVDVQLVAPPVERGDDAAGVAVDPPGEAREVRVRGRQRVEYGRRPADEVLDRREVVARALAVALARGLEAARPALDLDLVERLQVLGALVLVGGLARELAEEGRGRLEAALAQAQPSDERAEVARRPRQGDRRRQDLRRRLLLAQVEEVVEAEVVAGAPDARGGGAGAGGRAGGGGGAPAGGRQAQR